MIHNVDEMSFGLITSLGFGQRFEPTNVVHPQAHVKDLINLHEYKVWMHHCPKIAISEL